MDPQSVAECKHRWDTAGWCVIPDVIPADLLAAAQQALPSVFPTADEFADGVDPERNAAFMTERHSPSPTFPFEAEALNRVALHDNVIDLAERMLESADIRLYQGAVSAKYANAAPDYEQLLHADYGNHTLVVPRTDVGYQHVTMFVYLSDVTPETAATRVVSRESTPPASRWSASTCTSTTTRTCTRWRSRPWVRRVRSSCTGPTCSTGV